MSGCLTFEELNELQALYARQSRDKYLPAAVAEHNRQIRALIDEVQASREPEVGADFRHELWAAPRSDTTAYVDREGRMCVWACAPWEVEKPNV